MELLAHLHSQGVPVASALLRSDGLLLGQLEAAEMSRSCALFHHVDGVEISSLGELTIAKSYAIGRITAELHVAADSFDRPHNRYRLDHHYLVDEPLRLLDERRKQLASNPSMLEQFDEIDHFVRDLNPEERLAEAADALKEEPGTVGIIHADLHPGNMRFQEDNPTIFDFDHCAVGWRVYDLATTAAFPAKLRESVLAGYESVRTLSDVEREFLPLFDGLRDLWDLGDTLAMEAFSSE